MADEDEQRVSEVGGQRDEPGELVLLVVLALARHFSRLPQGAVQAWRKGRGSDAKVSGTLATGQLGGKEAVSNAEKSSRGSK